MIDFGKFYDRSILLLGNPFGTNCFIFICYRSNEICVESPFLLILK